MSEDGGETRVPVRISMDDPEPMYRQIESQLKDFILSGQLPAGTRLPSVRAFARDLACSVITTRRAYQDLENAGFVKTRQGMGTVVAKLGEDRKLFHRREPVLSAFNKAVDAGRQAGYTEEELREIFEETLNGRSASVRREE